MKRSELNAQLSILAEIRRMRYKPTISNLKPTPSPFRDTGGTILMRIAREDWVKIMAAVKARKQTAAQVVHSRDW